jgi:hypothetical protein
MAYALPFPNKGRTSDVVLGDAGIPLIRVARRARIQTKGVVAPDHGVME